LNICFIVVAIGFFVNIFTIPKNGKIFFTAYYMLYAIGMAGINSGAINLIYDYVEQKKRVVALAISQALSGFAGFFTTVLVSPLVAYIQERGNVFLGMNVYAQQVVSAFAFLLILVILVYLNTIIKKIKNRENK